MDTKFPEIFSKLIKEKFRFDTVFAREWVMYEGLPETEADNRRKKVKLLKSGQQHPTDEDIIEFCDIFDCTPDYLLGFSETPHHETKDIQSILGLSAEASDKLLQISYVMKNALNALNTLLPMQQFIDILCNLSNLSYDYKEHLKQKSITYAGDYKNGVSYGTADILADDQYKITQYEISQLMAEIIANIKNNTETEWNNRKKQSDEELEIEWNNLTKEEDEIEWANLQAEAFDNAQTENGREE